MVGLDILDLLLPARLRDDQIDVPNGFKQFLSLFVREEALLTLQLAEALS